jgi:FkbM family methyltransferase
MVIHGKRLQIPLSHPLPDYLRQFRFYDRLPLRISTYIHARYGVLNCIDIGANIGDTVAAFFQQESDTFLAVEPNPNFNKLLRENWGSNRNVIIVEEVCSSGSKEGNFEIQQASGTAIINQSKEGIVIKCRSLDEILEDHPSAKTCNVLKIDTDGHDYEVIRGAHKLIIRNKPVVLFECDVFENANYVGECLEALSIFSQAGYKHFLVYDNFGHLMGRYCLSDLTAFKNLLFYQLTSTFCYFDILIMRDEDIIQFFKEELNYFVGMTSNKVLQRIATAASGVQLKSNWE